MAIAGVGTKLQKKTGTDTYVDIGGVLNIGGPSMSRDTIDTTSLDTTGGYRTFMAGFKTPGTLKFTLMFDKTQYADLKDDFESDTPQVYRIVLPDGGASTGSTFEFEGLVTELPLTIPPEDKITCDVTIQISGAVTFTPAT